MKKFEDITDQEIAEIELIRSLTRWTEVGLGDERLMDTLLKFRPGLIINMASRIAVIKPQIGGGRARAVSGL